MAVHLDELRSDYRERLKASLALLVDKLKLRPDVLHVGVFGSYARGRTDLFTDLDILVIMKTDLSFVDRQRLLYEWLASPVDLDILCYTPGEFEFMKEQPFLRNALRDEKVLYEKKSA